MRCSEHSILFAAAAALLLLAGGCVSPTPYQPLSPTHRSSGGYADRRLTEDSYEVTFRGNVLTSREQVENYLLFRAAELTLAHGFDWFQVIDHEMDREVKHEIRPDPMYHPRYGGWQPYWRYRTMGMGWTNWDPYLGDPFFTNEVEVTTVEKFEATAEIRFGRGLVPSGNGRYLDARAIQARIGPTVKYPEER